MKGYIIQSRSRIRSFVKSKRSATRVPGFTGVISDLGGLTTNMYMLRCTNPRAEQTCRRACVRVSGDLHLRYGHQPRADHQSCIAARVAEGIKKI
ncbi:hypothetical protein M8494_27635 [Serratia ureilytica]